MKKRKTRIINLAILTTIIAALVCIFLCIKHNHSFGSRAVDKVSDLMNIDSVSDEFMDNYLATYAEVSQNYDTENMLIITAKDEPLDNYGAVATVYAPNHQYFFQYDTREAKNIAFSKLRANPAISVAENAHYELLEDENDDSTYNSWGIERMGLDYATEIIEGWTPADVTVAIIDTGCDMDLFNANYPGKIDETYSVLDPDAEMTDEYGHGTHIAGTIAEGTPSNVKILPVKISSGNTMSVSDIITAINYIAAGDKADVINMSFGGVNASDDNPEYVPIEAARQKNIISVAAAGNDATDAPAYPSAFDNTISVSAINKNDLLADFSSYGDMITFTAPGVDILSINGTKSGTSMAAPHVVSAVAIVKSIDKNLSFEGTIDVLKTQATDLGAEGWDHLYGNGLIDFDGAKICESASSLDCDEYGIFEKDVPNSISVRAILTPYNYGSLTNILASEITITTTNGDTLIKQLGDLDDINITGYDPYSADTQSVTVEYSGLTTSFEITNPNDYEMGWEYWENDGAISIHGYKDHNLGIKKLYFPETIDGLNVSEIWQSFYGSSDCPFYTYMYLPRMVTSLDNTFLNISGEFDNIEKVVSGADVITLSGSTFSGLKKLKTLDVTIRLTDDSASAFSLDQSLTAVRLSEDTTIIPANAFAMCNSLESIDLPNGITEIGEYAFNGASIRNIVFPDSLTKIGDKAFQVGKLESIAFGRNVSEIGDDAFYMNTNLQNITVDPNNPTFDSRNNSNALINTANNTLVLGAANTVVPDTVTTIGEKAFFNLKWLKEVTLPESVVRIESLAFAGCNNLLKLVVPRNVSSIEPNAIPGGTKLVMWVYENSYAHDFAITHWIVYALIDNPPSYTPAGANISFPILDAENRSFTAFETLTPENTSIEVFYYDENGDIIEEPEIITDFKVEYGDDGEYDSLRAGDPFVVFVTFDTSHGFYNFVSPVLLLVNKAVPSYTVPDDLAAIAGSRLDTIDLPDGFSWMDGSEIITGSGDVDFLAMYTPEDTDNYEIVENIPITIKIVELTPDDTIIKTADNTVADVSAKLGHSVKLADVVTLLDKDGAEIEFDDATVVGTGYTLQLTFGDKTYDYKIAVTGDLSSDGSVNSADLLQLRRHLLDIEILAGPYFAAADMEEDNVLNSADLLRMRQHLIRKGLANETHNN